MTSEITSLSCSNSLPRVIAVHGLGESGKSTQVADVLIEAFGYQRGKFATGLKNMLRSLLRDAGFDSEAIERCIEGDMKDAPLDVLGGKTTRYAMQVLGTEWREMICTPLWVNITLSWLRNIVAADQRAIIDDLRFPHEVSALEAFEVPVRLWKIVRPGHKMSAAGHSSEAGLPDAHFELILINDGTPAQIQKLVTDALADPDLKGQISAREWAPSLGDAAPAHS